MANFIIILCLILRGISAATRCYWAQKNENNSLGCYVDCHAINVPCPCYYHSLDKEEDCFPFGLCISSEITNNVRKGFCTKLNRKELLCAGNCTTSQATHIEYDQIFHCPDIQETQAYLGENGFDCDCSYYSGPIKRAELDHEIQDELAGMPVTLSDLIQLPQVTQSIVSAPSTVSVTENETSSFEQSSTGHTTLQEATTGHTTTVQSSSTQTSSRSNPVSSYRTFTLKSSGSIYTNVTGTTATSTASVIVFNPNNGTSGFTNSPAPQVLVGAIVGGAALVLSILAFIIWFHARRSRADHNERVDKRLSELAEQRSARPEAIEMASRPRPMYYSVIYE